MTFAQKNDLPEAPLERSQPWYLWTDFETTGLDHDLDVPLEFGFVVTNVWGEVIPGTASSFFIWEYEGPYGNQYRERWANCDQFVQDMHEKSGLSETIQLIKSSKTRKDMYTNESIEDETLEFLFETLNMEPETLRVAGSSIHYDKTFVHDWMPKLEANLHYRALDVSSLIEMVQNTNPILAVKMPAKRDIHRVLPDIADSITTYRWMLDNFVMPDWRVFDGTQEENS